MKIYEEIPKWESENYVVRGVLGDDIGDLLEVYSDKNALPFFNSDNCDGDNFYYSTEKKMGCPSMENIGHETDSGEYSRS